MNHLNRTRRLRWSGCVLWASLVLLFATPSRAQEIIKSYTGFWDEPNGLPDVAFLDDLDGDPYGEPLIGDAAWGSGDEGRVSVLSGALGNPVYELQGPAMAFLGKRVANLGDVDGDGVIDFGATGDWFNGLFRVWSGNDGSVLCEVPNVSQGIARIGDLDGDDRQDFVVGKPGEQATVYLASTCPMPHLIIGAPAFTGFFGWAAVGLGDVTGDRTPDFAVSAPGGLGNIDCLPGYVGVFSGADGSLVWDLHGETAYDRFGWSLAAPGDLSGDGIGDLVVGAPLADGVDDCQTGAFGRIYFLDGPTGMLIDKIVTLDNYDTMGHEVSRVGDANGNGVPDVLVSNQDHNLVSGGYEILLVEGASGDTIYTVVSSYGFTVNYGFAMAGVGDGDGDDFPDFVAGGAGTGLGRLDLYSGAPIGVSTFGTACPTASGTLPRIGATGSPFIGSKYPLHLSQVAPGLTAFLALGLSNTNWQGMPLPLDLGPIGMPGCDLLVAPKKILATQTSQVSPREGAATVEVPIPDLPALVGSSGYAQWFVVNPPGSPTLGATTRGLQLTLQAPLP